VFDPISYTPGEAINPFGAEFRDRFNAAGAAAEGLNNAQSGDEAALFAPTDSGIQFEGRPEDDMPGPIVTMPRMLAGISTEVAATPGTYTARELIWDDDTPGYGDLTDGFEWDDAGGKLTDLYCRQGYAGVAKNTPVEVWAERDIKGRIRWVFDWTNQPWFWAKITGNADLGGGATNRWKYAWTEQDETADSWADLAGGRTGSTTSGYALNGLEMPGTLITAAIPNDTVVKLYAGISTANAVVYRFDAGGGGGDLPAPGTLYQVLQLQGTPLIPVWDWVRAR